SQTIELQPGQFIDVDRNAVRMVFDIEAPDQKSLLYRSCYNDIYELVADKTSQIDITGTAGTGKSAMLFFFLLLFLKKGKTVVVATRGTDPSYLVIKPDDAGITVNLQSWRPQHSSFVYLPDVPDPSKD